MTRNLTENLTLSEFLKQPETEPPQEYIEGNCRGPRI